MQGIALIRSVAYTSIQILPNQKDAGYEVDRKIRNAHKTVLWQTRDTHTKHSYWYHFPREHLLLGVQRNSCRAAKAASYLQKNGVGVNAEVNDATIDILRTFILLNKQGKIVWDSVRHEGRVKKNGRISPISLILHYGNANATQDISVTLLLGQFVSARSVTWSFPATAPRPNAAEALARLLSLCLRDSLEAAKRRRMRKLLSPVEIHATLDSLDPLIATITAPDTAHPSSRERHIVSLDDTHELPWRVLDPLAGYPSTDHTTLNRAIEMAQGLLAQHPDGGTLTVFDRRGRAIHSEYIGPRIIDDDY